MVMRFKKTMKTADIASQQPEIKLSIKELRELVDTPKMVGTVEELVPFAWRNPLLVSVADKKASKMLKNLAQAEQDRQLLGTGKDN